MPAAYDASSRYSLDENGQSATRIPPQTTKYTLYTVSQGDTIESIAHRHLGNFRRFWEIADANPQIKFPQDIAIGTVLRLPS